MSDAGNPPIPVPAAVDSLLKAPPDFTASLFKTPPRPSGNAGPETSFDSGFFSPLKFSDSGGSEPSTSSLNTPPLTFGASKENFDDITDVSNDVNIDDWDTNFIENFEENVFMMNDIDEKILEEIMKSPQGKVLQEKAREQDIPLKNLAFSPVRVKKSPDDNRLRLVDLQVQNVLTQQNIQQNFEVTVPLNVPIQPFLPFQGKVRFAENKNMHTIVWPSKEKLLYARKNFQQILAKAVKESIVKNKEREDMPKPQCDKYPQLKKALSKLNSRTSLFRSPSPSAGLIDSINTSRRTKRQIQLFRDDDDDDKEYWHGKVPFSSKVYQGPLTTPLHDVSDSSDTDTDSANEDKGKGLISRNRRKAGYKVQRKSNCKVVIKKLRK